MRYYGLKTKKDRVPLDQYIHEKYITSPFKHGSFLELGAINGIKFSNTKFFEDNMGFDQGVLIEPEPELYEALVTNRPNCECFNYAIHSEAKNVEFMTSNLHDWGGCVQHDDSQSHIELFHETGRFENHSTTSTLPAERLDVILHQSRLKYIDFWSLDVEGSELQCLDSMDWSIPVGLICVETFYHRDTIHEIIISKGFKLIEQKNHDSFYFNPNYTRKKYFNQIIQDVNIT